MAVVRWDPFRDLSMLQDRMNRLFDDAGRTWRADEPASTTTWSPAVDIFETEGEIVVKAELPGMDRKDITLHLENNVLTLRGERQVRERDERRKLSSDRTILRRRSAGHFPFRRPWMKRRSAPIIKTAY